MPILSYHNRSLFLIFKGIGFSFSSPQEFGLLFPSTQGNQVLLSIQENQISQHPRKIKLVFSPSKNSSSLLSPDNRRPFTPMHPSRPMYTWPAPTHPHPMWMHLPIRMLHVIPSNFPPTQEQHTPLLFFSLLPSNIQRSSTHLLSKILSSSLHLQDLLKARKCVNIPENHRES